MPENVVQGITCYPNKKFFVSAIKMENSRLSLSITLIKNLYLMQKKKKKNS